MRYTMKNTIPDGVYPTMITPYQEDGRIDWAALEALVEWHIERGVAGYFAVCQSSEMFHLSLRERLELARMSIKFARGRVPVLVSGHVADTLDDQIEEAKMMADTGADAFILVTNRLARRHESDEVFKRNLELFLSRFDRDILLGFYECPAPYKRLLNADLTRFVVGTGRFGFLKDTSCRMGDIRAKIEAARGSNFKLFNANAATLLGSLQAGAAGYSGIMTHFHSDLYVWICRHWKDEPELARELQEFLGLASVIEYQLYPVNAMYALQLEGLPIKLYSRRADARQFTESMRLEVEQMMRLSHRFSERYKE
ncbi:Dihydrodipicolinate synthase [uncultured spirochete]|uniref:Dihydrodipicolinate synthase n=1 Tax=uncultured spirochete TaxID=156406 RepID=A0A3P3XNY8_9SPIR|nr:Dihydrodipicolinate synthase [uncultured spirochete]